MRAKQRAARGKGGSDPSRYLVKTACQVARVISRIRNFFRWPQEDQPIGDLQLRDASDALYVKGRLLKDDIPQAKTAYALIKAGVIEGLSIGYDTVKDSIEGGVRHPKELRLWEGSIVTFPMNEMATIAAVKSPKCASS